MGNEFPIPETIAALDLGSNSFHLVLAKLRHGEIVVIDHLREAVRLAGGVDEGDRIAPEAMERALQCLARFEERLRNIPAAAVRAVGTNALRLAGNAEEFRSTAEQVLGHPIEVISGIEEARLIYQGVAHSMPLKEKRGLVVDIGGGSTEFIIGAGFEPILLESTAMGAVTLTQRYFPNGEITSKRFRSAELVALMQIEPLQSSYRGMGWEVAIGASGTIRAVDRVIRESGWGDGEITSTSLKKLAETLLRAGHVNRLKLPGLSERRKTIFPGGVVILLTAFDALGIERMRVSDGGLREGILNDLFGRLRHEDVRGHSIENLAKRFGVDLAQAAQVASTALFCLDQVAQVWALDGDETRLWLRWAAHLHEVGFAISHTGYHKHGAYILENADLPGFSRQEQLLLAQLVRSHRRKLTLQPAKKTNGENARTMLRLAILLRLAVTMHRNRSNAPLPHFQLKAQDAALQISFPGRWLNQHPLTRADLEQESELLNASGFRLEID